MVPRPTMIVGTRGSRLAVSQTEMMVAALKAAHSDLQVELRLIQTQGDKDQTTSLSSIGGQGVFVKELEKALLAGDVDIVVHSLKDMPAAIAPGLTLAAMPQRGDPRDALVAGDGVTLAELPAGARVGTGSRRRAVQLRALRPDIETADIRGNVDTRIRKVDDGEYDAVVLANAGLGRLGLSERASQVFEPDALIPAVGQGALVIEAREDDAPVLKLLTSLNHEDTHLACDTERAFMARLGGGCQLPFGAYATVSGDSLTIKGFVADDDGERRFQAEATVTRAAAPDAGTKLAERLLGEGAAEFMATAEAS